MAVRCERIAPTASDSNAHTAVAGLDRARPSLARRIRGAAMSPARGAGIGLANARERLRHLYGDAQSFAFESTPQHGTRITLRFPYRIVTEEAA